MLDFQIVNKILENQICNLNKDVVIAIVKDLDDQLKLQKRAKAVRKAGLQLEKTHRAEYAQWKARQQRLYDDCPHLSLAYVEGDGRTIPCNICGANV